MSDTDKKVDSWLHPVMVTEAAKIALLRYKTVHEAYSALLTVFGFDFLAAYDVTLHDMQLMRDGFMGSTPVPYDPTGLVLRRKIPRRNPTG